MSDTVTPGPLSRGSSAAVDEGGTSLGDGFMQAQQQQAQQQAQQQTQEQAQQQQQQQQSSSTRSENSR